MTSQVTEKSEAIYEQLWTNTDVRNLHARFDSELEEVKDPKGIEGLMKRFFGPVGLMEKGLDVWRGAAVSADDVMNAAAEFIQFKFLIQVDFFLHGYSEELVKKWWKERGPKPFNHEDSYQDESVKRLFRRFNEDAQGATMLSDLEHIGELYLSPTGVLACEFAKAEALEESQQIQKCAELFQLRGHIEFSLFAVDFGAKAERWTVSFVRALVYTFERDLKGIENEKAFLELKGRLLGKGGLVDETVALARKEKNIVAEEELKLFRASLEEFFQGENK